MTGSTSVSVLVPLAGPSSAAAAARETIERYLETTGFTFEVIVPEAPAYGSALRKGVSEATGSVIVVVDAALPYAVGAIGDAVAMIDSGASEIVFGTTAGNRGVWFLRSFDGDVAHFLLITFWDSVESIQRFAGDDYGKARYYPEDKDYLLEFEENAIHYEVLRGPGL